MMRRFFASRNLWLLMWSCCWLATSGVQAASPADAVPESASVVVRWKTPQATLAKLGDYVEAVQPGYGAIVKGGLPVLGQAVSIPELDGIDVTKDWWLILFAESGEKPSLVFVIPVTDADALEKVLPEGFEIHSVDKLAIVSDDEESLGSVRELLEGKGTAIWSKVDAASKTLFDASDLSVLINAKQLTDEFSSELEQAEPQLDAAIDQIAAAIPEEQRGQMEAVFNMYRELGKGALKGINDSDSLTLGITFTKDTIRWENRLQLTAGTESAKFLSSQTTSELALMSKLPANKLAYFGAKLDMASMIEWSMKSSRAMMTSMSDSQKTQFDAAAKQMTTLKYGEMAVYTDIDPKSPGALRIGSVTEVTPAERIRDISRSMTTAMNEIEFPGFKQSTTLEPGVDKISGTEFDRITIKQEADANSDPLGMQKKIRDLLFGDEGMQQLAMYQPKLALQTLGGGKTELQGLVTALASTTSKDAAVGSARKRLMEKANVVALVDVARMAANGVKLAGRENAIPDKSDAINALKLSPSFAGFAFSCESTALRTQLDVPLAQAQGVAKILMLFIGGAQ
jgi:hypothetical protein